MRYMALDIGDVRVGVAVSDACGKVASPVCVLDASAVRTGGREWTRVLDDWQPDALVFGRPLGLAGEPTAQTARVEKVAVQIAAAAHLPHYFADERLSSKQARAALRDMGYDEKHMRGKVDMLAASIFLQSFLDAQNGEGEDGDKPQA